MLQVDSGIGRLPVVSKKYQLTITVDEAVIQEIKIRAVREKRSVGEITEELYREYLKRPLPKK